MVQIVNMNAGGKAGGGSSSTNGLYYARGSASVYDDWVTLGNPGWGWDDVYPLFVKVRMSDRRDARQVPASGSTRPHGTCGA